jgi:hypothetical protein
MPTIMLKRLTFLLGIALVVSSCTTTDPLTVTNNEIGDKTGRVSNTCIFGFEQSALATAGVAGGQKITSAGICLNNDEYFVSEAASKANIKEIGAIDLRTTDYFLWTKYELLVHGK